MPAATAPESRTRRHGVPFDPAEADRNYHLIMSGAY